MAAGAEVVGERRGSSMSWQDGGERWGWPALDVGGRCGFCPGSSSLMQPPWDTRHTHTTHLGLGPPSSI